MMIPLRQGADLGYTSRMPTHTTDIFELQALLPSPYYCLGCAERVCGAISKVSGVMNSRCTPEEGELEITYDPAVVTGGELAERIRALALEVTGAVGHAMYRLTGLD